MPSSWSKPLAFIESIGDRFVINKETAQLLKEIDKPIIPVAIAGVYRTGKSYLMNCLARKKNGFPLGNTVQSKTKGIWLWYCDHPHFPDKALLLLDTEGLSDPEKGDERHDMAVFSLAILLCTMFIFNATGKIDQEMINKLHFVTELTDTIRVRSSPKSSDEDDEGATYNEFAKYFPGFVLAVRDFMLQLEIHGKPVSADQYFEHVLQFKTGSSKKNVDYNLSREAIRSAFRTRNCFVFPRPVDKDELFIKLEELSESELSSVFLAQAELFCNFVFRNSTEKLISGRSVNGRLFLRLAEQYTEAINNGAVPCIESTVTLVAEKENRHVQEESIKFYREQMEQIDLPVTQDDLAEAHKVAYDVAMEYFRRNVVFDEKGTFNENLLKNVEEAYGEMLNKNEDASTAFCEVVLLNLYENTVGKKMEKQEYTCPGGYKKFDVDMQQLKENYNIQKGKGVMAEIVYSDFVKSKQSERTTILSADTMLSAQEKKVEAAQKAKEAAETETRLRQEALEEEKKLLNQMAQEHQVQLHKLKEENEQQMQNRLKEVHDTLDSKLKEREKLLEQGFNEKADAMKAEIERLQEECKPSKFCSYVDTFSNVLNAVGMFGMGASGLKSMGGGIKSVGGRVLRFIRR